MNLATKKINYVKDKISFDTSLFNFREIIIFELNKYLLEKELKKIYDLSRIHTIDNIYRDFENYRQIFFEIFRSEYFKNKYKLFGRWLIDSFFDKNALIQKTPTIRLVLPGGKSASFHTDLWYGHGKKVNSFWLPLTKVSGINSLLMAKEVNDSKRLIKRIKDEKMNLDKINSEARKISEPIESDYGALTIFNKDILHGTLKNTSNASRVSFDFRIATSSCDLGNKPKANFYSYGQLIDDKSYDHLVLSENQRNALTYTGICGKISSKNQLLFLNSFAKSNNINIIASESEILIFDFCPVLTKYCKNPEINIDCILLFGTALLPKDFNLRSTIYKSALFNKIQLIFASEDIIFANEEDIKLVEENI